MREFSFGPAEIVVQPGRQVTLDVRNDGDMTHNFSAPSVGPDLDYKPGARRTVIFAAPASGVVEFFCKFHRERGMRGAVRVVARPATSPPIGLLLLGIRLLLAGTVVVGVTRNRRSRDT